MSLYLMISRGFRTVSRSPIGTFRVTQIYLKFVCKFLNYITLSPNYSVIQGIEKSKGV